MKVGFFCSNRQRCIDFAYVFKRGVEALGDECEVRPVLKAHGDPHTVDGDIVPDVDVAVINAVLHKKAFRTMYDAGIPVVYLDKAYNRDWNYRRVSIGGHQPTHYLGYRGMPDDRRKLFGWNPLSWRRPTDATAPILLAWSDDRDHEWRDWPVLEDHIDSSVKQLKHFTGRTIYARCKPNRAPARQVNGMTWLIDYDLQSILPGNYHALVTPGTSVCLTALLAGIPTIVLADAIVRNISSTCVSCIERPYLAHEEEKLALLNDLSYCQWHLGEFATGAAWRNVRQQLETGVGVNVKTISDNVGSDPYHARSGLAYVRSST